MKLEEIWCLLTTSLTLRDWIWGAHDGINLKQYIEVVTTTEISKKEAHHHELKLKSGF